jgi:PAS domain S-box-containing protein
VTTLRPARRSWLAYVLAGTAATALYHLWPSVAVQTVVALGLTAGALAALVAGIRLHRPAQRRAWRVLVVGQAAAFVSWVLWQYAIATHGEPPATGSVEDLFWITNSLSLLAAIVLLRRANGSGSTTLLDSGIVGSALAILTWIFLFGPALESSTGSALAAQATYAFMDVAMMAILAPLALQRAVRTPAGTMLLLGTVAVLATDLLFTWSSATGASMLGAWDGAGWLLFPVLIGGAALHPSMARLYDRRVRRDEEPTTPYLVVLTVALLAVLALLAFELLGGREIDSPLVLALSTVLSLLVLRRLAGLVRRGDDLRRDLAAQNRALRERTAAVEILREIADATDGSSSADEALARGIDAICRAIGWPIGHAYVKERGSRQLAPTQIWHLDDAARWAPFVRLTQNLHFVAGHGLPGRVLASGRPEWLEAREDDATHPRAAVASELGIRAAFAFPVLVKGEVAAVLEFFSPAAIDPDPWLTELSRAAGSQLARALERSRAEASLRASEARFRGFVANVPGAIYRISSDAGARAVHFLSENIADICGYAAADFVDGRVTAYDVVHPDDQAALDQTMEEAIAAERDFSLEYRMLHADGSVRWVSETGRPVHDEATGELWLDGLIVDVTERKEAERLLREAEDRYRTLVEELPMITYADTPGPGDSGVWHPHYVSSQLESLLGWSPAEWLSDADFFFDHILHPDDRDRVLAEHELAYRETAGLTLEYRLLHRDGSPRWFLDRMVIVRDENGAPRWSQGYLQDITERKEAEERLTQAERRYRTLVEQLPLATYIDALEGAGGSTYLSPQIGELVGHPPEEWLADRQLFSKLLHPEDRARVLAEVRRATAASESVLQEYRVISKDGRTVWLRDSAVVVRDEAETPLYRQGYVVDVTAQKNVEAQLREAEERYRTLVEQLPLVTYVDAPRPEDSSELWDGVYVSPQIESVLGYTAEEWLGQNYLELIHPDDREWVTAEHERAYGTLGEFDAEYRFVHRDGRTVWVRDEMMFVGGEDGEPLCAQGYLLDISSLKHNEAELVRLLEREREQNEELRTLDRLKDEFIALVSHELRTPLTSIRGYLELVLEGSGRQLSAEQEQFLGVVQRNADRLQNLVADLLFIAQIEAGRLELEQGELDLAALAHESVETGRPLAAAKDIELSLVVEPVCLVGDRGRLGQLLDNFVSNAIKFTPAGGGVEVRLSVDAGTALLEVSDNGMGIPADEQERLFERFFRSSTATAQAIQGTGLGLTISKAIAEAHGGRITFTSVENEGTTFHIELPVAARFEVAA